ncbi:MAG: alanine racemase [Caldilineaceae bacterium]
MTNLQIIKRLLRPTTRLMAVVKGNGYGHDALTIARIAAVAGADWLAVATPGEGLELRTQGITLPILVLGYTPAWAVATALQHNLTLTVDAQATIDAIVQAAQTMGRQAYVHIKVNTGMNRLGLLPSTVVPFLQQLANEPALVVEGIYTHFATADQEDDSFLMTQFGHFQTMLRALAAERLRPPVAHAANSAATLRYPSTHLDMVRCGIALYGLHPDPQTTPLPTAIQPVLSWKAQVVHLTALQPGDSVGYGRAFVAKQAITVATIPVGYADGFPRSPQQWGEVLLHGHRVPIVGRVCMDQTMVDVTPLMAAGQPVQEGDEVVLIGKQGKETLSAEEIGQRTGTINYEVVSRILPRVPRVCVLGDHGQQLSSPGDCRHNR